MKPNENGYDPNLKQAMEEIKPILQKYDCMASIVLVSPKFSEYLNHLQSSWSVIKFEETEEGRQILRFRSKKEDWPSKESQVAATNASAHALTTIVEWTRTTNEAFRYVIAQLGTKMKIAWETWDGLP